MGRSKVKGSKRAKGMVISLAGGGGQHLQVRKEMPLKAASKARTNDRIVSCVNEEGVVV